MSAFGAVTAGPIELLDSGIGWDPLPAALVGAAAGAVVGLIFPTLLSRRHDRRVTSAPPLPPHPPPPPRIELVQECLGAPDDGLGDGRAGIRPLRS
jgi:hypothetical protein